VKLFYGLANRSAAIRIPKYANTPESKRFEFRTGDATCNPTGDERNSVVRLGWDQHKSILVSSIWDPSTTMSMPGAKKKNPSCCRFRQPLRSHAALRDDHAFLLEGAVFNVELIGAISRGNNG
jgi:glutamine synthetase